VSRTSSPSRDSLADQRLRLRRVAGSDDDAGTLDGHRLIDPAYHLLHQALWNLRPHQRQPAVNGRDGGGEVGGSQEEAELASPGQTHWDGQDLTFEGRPVDFIVNRSTDFLRRSEDFAALRKAYETGRVYVAPNPFTYVTRSDKRQLEWLSLHSVIGD
jgi:hypothetical protein